MSAHPPCSRKGPLLPACGLKSPRRVKRETTNSRFCVLVDSAIIPMSEMPKALDIGSTCGPSTHLNSPQHTTPQLPSGGGALARGSSVRFKTRPTTTGRQVRFRNWSADGSSLLVKTTTASDAYALADSKADRPAPTTPTSAHPQVRFDGRLAAARSVRFETGPRAETPLRHLILFEPPTFVLDQ